MFLDFFTASSSTLQIFTGWPLTRNRLMEGVVSRRLIEVKRILAYNSTTHDASSWWSRLMSRFRRSDSLSDRMVRQLQPHVSMYPPPRAFSLNSSRHEQMAAARTSSRRPPPRTEIDRGDLVDLPLRSTIRPRGFPVGVPAAPINSDQLVERELFRVMGSAGPWQFL